MPTTKPRITITLEPRTHHVLTRLSVAGGESMSSLIGQLVDLAVPSMERLVVVLENAKNAPQEVKSGLLAAIERAERQLLPAAQTMIDQADLFLADACVAVGAVPAPGAAAPAADGATEHAPKGKRRASGDPGLRAGMEAAAEIVRSRKVPLSFPTPVPVTRGSGAPGEGEQAPVTHASPKRRSLSRG